MTILKSFLLKNKLVKYLTNIFKLFIVYLSAVGIISGGCFIAEESIQLMCFANFSGTDIGRYDLVLKNLDRMERVNTGLRRINSILLVIQPIAWFGYVSFCDSTSLYVDTLQAEILAHEPALLLGRSVSIRFRYNSLKNINKDLVWAIGAKVKAKIRKDSISGDRMVAVTGLVALDLDRGHGRIVVD